MGEELQLSVSCCRPDSWPRLQNTCHHVAKLTPCWVCKRPKSWGQHGVQDKEVWGQSSVREGSGETEVLSRTASNQQGLEQLGAGAKGQEGGSGRETCPLCAGLLHPLLLQHNDLQGRNDSLQL